MTKQFWIGLFVLFSIYTLYYLFFIESSYYYEIPRKLRHVIKFSTLIIVYFIGLVHLKFGKSPWMRTLWHIVHIFGISLLTIIGLYDWFINNTGPKTRIYMSTVNEFLISPTLYVSMGILNKYLLKFK